MTTPYDDTTTATDSDGDGYPDTFSHDLDGDGYLDTIAVVDGQTGAMAVGMDTDGDGELDTVLIDHDGDGYADEGYTLPGTEAATSMTDPAADPADQVSDPYDPVSDPYAVDDPYDPAAHPDAVDDPFVTPGTDLPTAGEDGVHGDPRADIEYHTVQPGPVDCLPTSVSMIISEVTGETVSADDLADLADEKGFMNAGGMSAEDSLALLESYGVEAEVQQGTVDGLRTALDNGDQIIIGLDSADLYQGEAGPFDPGMTAGHAVVLTGIDDGPPAYAYINDPGFPDGAGVQVPLELFEDAWADSDHTMVVVEADQGAADGDLTTVGTDAGSAADAMTGTPSDTATDSAFADDTVAAGTATEDTAFTRLLLLPITLTADLIADLSS